MSAEIKTVRVRIKGRVQGVWYRGWTVREAQQRGLSGWVKNRFDGDVEAVFHGTDDAVEEMIAACWNGPRAAKVVAVTVEPSTKIPESGFRQVADE